MNIDRLFFEALAFIGLLTFAYICMAWGEFKDILRQTINHSHPPGPAQQFDTNRKLSDIKFYTSYHVKGFLRLPHSNLNEPIEVWYNKEHNNSRIDYYHGEVKTYQDGLYGIGGRLIKVIPKYDSLKKKHTIGCLKRIGHKPGKYQAQSIIPTKWSWPFEVTLESFKNVGEEIIQGKLCTKWRYSHKLYDKNNVYTFWVQKTNPPVPVRYEMNGYDTLLTSYYDKYIIDYTLYEKWDYNKDVMLIPQYDSSCSNLSKLQHHGDGGEFSVNPMAEFMPNGRVDDPIESEFRRYRRHHRKIYDENEHFRRKHIYRHNARFIRSVNRRNLNYKLKLNSFADMTDKEYMMHKGALPDEHDEVKRGKRFSKRVIHENYKPNKHFHEIPDELDWRKFGAVSKPRGQGTCGSCWAFAAVGALESANFLKTGKLVELSEQQMIDCTWRVKGVWGNSGNGGCQGGFAWKVFFWGRSNKIATSKSYGPYRGKEGYCKTENLTVGAKINGFHRVKKWNPTALRKAIAYHGPAVVSINSHPLSLKFYSHGILDDKSCNNGTDHAVLVVGYGRENGINYWLVKNSWSTSWGDKGYIKIKENFCGVMKKPVVVYNRHHKPYPWNKKTKRHKKNHKKGLGNSKKNRRKKKWHRFA